MSEIRIIPFEEHYTDQVVDLILPIQQTEFGIEISLTDQPDLLKIKEEYIDRGGKLLVGA